MAETLVNQLLGFGVESYNDLADALTLLLHKVMAERDRMPVMAFSFKGEYNGEFDHLPPDEKEYMMNVREQCRNLFLL